ncbi:MFS transporter [Aestuariivirga sp.]|uniref:MFS transporter n=1 Tax=Aestuariivirga sp. TaxID=2650926 RepID=UPI003BAD043E
MADAAIRAKASPLLSLLALGNFVVGMGVFVVIGIVTPIAEGLGISKSDAGILITSYSIAYAVLSPIGAALTGRMRRRTVLAAALGLFCIGTLVSAMAGSLTILTLSRLIVALGAALYTPLSAGVAVAITAPEQRGRALAQVFGGITLAQVVGVPLGAWMAYRFGWHAPFFLVSFLTAICMIVLIRMIPRDIHVPSGSVTAIFGTLANVRLMLAVSFTATLMASVYVVFTYFGPIIETSAGLSPETRSLYFVLFGIGAVGGNYVGGFLSDRFGPIRTLILVCVAHMAFLPLFSVMPWNPWLLALLVLVWSSFAWCFMPPQQSRLVAMAPEMAALALALNAAMLYLGIAIGSAVAAQLLAWGGLPVLGVAAGIAATCALLHLLLSIWVSGRKAAI